MFSTRRRGFVFAPDVATMASSPQEISKPALLNIALRTENGTQIMLLSWRDMNNRATEEERSSFTEAGAHPQLLLFVDKISSGQPPSGALFSDKMLSRLRQGQHTKDQASKHRWQSVPTAPPSAVC